MANEEPKLKLWHWYAETQPGGTCVVVMPIEEQGDGIRCVYVGCDRRAVQVGRTPDEHVRLHIGPIAGPGEPPPAPVDRGDAENSAREWARGMLEPVRHALDALENVDVRMLPDLIEGLDPECQEQQHEQARRLIRAGLLSAEGSATLRAAFEAKERAHVVACQQRDAYRRERDKARGRVAGLEREVQDAHDANHGLAAELNDSERESEGYLRERARRAEQSLAAERDAEHLRNTLDRDDPSAPPAGHVRVRIAVSVTEDGRYLACATGGGCDDKEAMTNVDDWDGCTRYEFSFVEADVPLPGEPKTVRGHVTD